jgi:uncharacterized SAM-binding protein YcdF (DUF218 family)
MIGRVVKWGTVLGLLAVVGLSIYFTYLYSEIRQAAIHDEARASDAIVVLGAAQYNGRPSPVLKARLDHAFELYDKGMAHAIITTGSYGPDLNFSEAEVGRKYLVQRGVSVADIVTEQGSGTTHDSIQAASALLKAKGWKSAVVVSDGFHLFRVKKMFADNGILAYTSPAPDSPIEIAASQRFWHSMREVVLLFAYRWMDL